MRSTGPVAARSCSATTRRVAGNLTSISSATRCLQTAVARVSTRRACGRPHRAAISRQLWRNGWPASSRRLSTIPPPSWRRSRNPHTATRISTAIDRLLVTAGAEDLTAPLYGERLVRIDGCVFLRPTVIWCDNPDHPLANTEYLFPFVSVVELPQAQIPQTIGPSLVVTALSEEAEFQAVLMESTGDRSSQPGFHPDLSRLLGPASRGQSVRTPLQAALFCSCQCLSE